MEGTRKIITKAIYGQKTEQFEKQLEIGADENSAPEKVLGGTVTGMEIKECVLKSEENNITQVEITGEYGVHIWFQTGEETKIFHENITFSDILNVETKGEERVGHQELRAWIEKQPTATQELVVTQNGKIINVKIQYNLGVEIIAESTLYVVVASSEQDM